MPCNDLRPTSIEDLYNGIQKRLDGLTDLMCRTMKDAEEQGVLTKLRGDAQEWWKKHQSDDSVRRDREWRADVMARFLLLSTKEQWDLIAKLPKNP